MSMYSFLREIADSWVLLMMFVFFLGTIVWAFRPGSKALHDDAGSIPLRNDAPASGTALRGRMPQKGNANG